MSLDRPNETEFQLAHRRGREAAERAAIFDAACAARRAAGIPDIPNALVALPGLAWGLPREGGVWS